MSKFKLPLLLSIMAFISMPALADGYVVKRVPAGAVAFHFVLDLTYAPGPPELVGYMAFIEGVNSPLFAGEPSKDTAYFTLRITTDIPFPIGLPVERDPELGVSMLPPGVQFKVFYDSTPGPRMWNNPDSFSEGLPIAVFEESALLGTTGHSASFNVFSSKLIDSTAIDFNGQTLDFKRVVPNGVTITNFGNGPRLREDWSFGSAAGATAIAIGGNFRGESDDD